VSRVDTEIDKRLDTLVSSHPGNRDTLKALYGKAAIANAKLAYRLFRAETMSPRWKALSAKGATVQRPLWASTSTKNPAYRDVMYVEELIGPDTVNTMPPATIDAFRDHGIVKRTVDANVDEAERTIRTLEDNGVSMRDVTDKLLADGLASFQKSFDTLLSGLQTKRKALAKELVSSR
jgi:transaldolase